MAVGVLRGRGPGASGSNLTEGGGFFSKEGTSAGAWMCLYVYQGLTVGWWKEGRHPSDTTAIVNLQGSNPRPDGPPMDVMLCAFRVVQKRRGEERVDVGGRGKYPGAPPHHQRKKGKKLVDRKVPDRPIW
ncbi:hypothetical protein MTP99_007659 [Tenebrio molitor]|nr:hypothetical protein MTP99_007659 [Tenebrio molitor]